NRHGSKRREEELSRRYSRAELDRKGEPLAEEEINEWTRRVLDELTACFGGATPIPAAGTNVVQSSSGGMVTLFEGGQVLVLSACESRAAFVRKRRRIETSRRVWPTRCGRKRCSCWRFRRTRSSLKP